MREKQCWCSCCLLSMKTREKERVKEMEMERVKVKEIKKVMKEYQVFLVTMLNLEGRNKHLVSYHFHGQQSLKIPHYVPPLHQTRLLQRVIHSPSYIRYLIIVHRLHAGV
jgi:hypothetical protein